MWLVDILLSMMGLLRLSTIQEPPEPLNFSGVPTAGCPVCGDQWLNVPMIFDDETYDVAAWALEGECFSCGTRVTVCCPVDKEREMENGYGDY